MQRIRLRFYEINEQINTKTLNTHINFNRVLDQKLKFLFFIVLFSDFSYNLNSKKCHNSRQLSLADPSQPCTAHQAPPMACQVCADRASTIHAVFTTRDQPSRSASSPASSRTSAVQVQRTSPTRVSLALARTAPQPTPCTADTLTRTPSMCQAPAPTSQRTRRSWKLSSTSSLSTLLASSTDIVEATTPQVC